ncbi:MAG: aminopeptidase P N-terminal domain-containing protein [Deltaproteobacteria bacterium]|nr:aminopeptidase P N-terminal domain-containing protein [Deltaproteobacteria bacterium]
MNLNLPFSVKTYRQRRDRLMKELSKNEQSFTAFFWSGSEIVRNYDSHFPFRANSDFLYLTGCSEPDTLILLQKIGNKTRTSIGVRPRDLSHERGSEIWEGERLGVERAPKALGFDEAFDIHKVQTIAEKYMSQAPTLFWGFGEYPEWDQKIVAMISKVHHNNRGIAIVKNIRDPRPALHEIRKVKTSEEVAIMRRSAEVAARGHIRAMRTTKAGQFEYQIAAEVEREFKKGGSEFPAYGSIVATGNNACTLHYRANNTKVKDGEIILIDAGAEYQGYASDITRCYPISGKFSPPQKEVYNWVLKSQIAAIKAVKPGVDFFKPHIAAVKVLCEGLSKMKIIKQSPKVILKKGLWKNFMPHGTSHWLGLDVHDRGVYKRVENPSESVKLMPGNVLTIEPGLYFRKDDKRVPAAYRGIGIRIEDDVLVTKKSYDVLSESCPKTVEDIEAACGPKL